VPGRVRASDFLSCLSEKILDNILREDIIILNLSELPRINIGGQECVSTILVYASVLR
jgi:hypothetical protein